MLLGIQSLVFILVLVAQPGQTVAKEEYEDQEHRLLEYLLDENRAGVKYMSKVRPTESINNATKVVFRLALNEIIELNNNRLVLNTWEHKEWDDYRLKWDPSDFGGLKHVNLPQSMLWKPDIVQLNSLLDDNIDNSPDSLVTVTYEGKVTLVERMLIKSVCKLDLRYHPNDEQLCELRYGSWVYTGDEVELGNIGEDMHFDLENYAMNLEWKLINIHSAIKILIYECCPEPYPYISIRMHVKRRVGFYESFVRVPGAVCALVTPFIFLISPDNHERITLGIGLLICLTIQMTVLADYFPRRALTNAGIQYVSAISMVAIAVVISTILLNVYNRRLRKSRLPRCLAKITKCCARVCCLKFEDIYTETDETGMNQIDKENQPNKDTKIQDGTPCEISGATEWWAFALILDRLLFVIFMIFALINVISGAI